MWPITAEDRLREWYLLRTQAVHLPLEECLHTINDWWANAPQNKRHLNWWEMHDWPSPWDLLAENVYCDLAQALGIVYTLSLSSHSDASAPEIHIYRDEISRLTYHLAIFDQGKYVVNFLDNEIVNIKSLNKTMQLQYQYTRADLKLE